MSEKADNEKSLERVHCIQLIKILGSVFVIYCFVELISNFSSLKSNFYGWGFCQILRDSMKDFFSTYNKNI